MKIGDYVKAYRKEHGMSMQAFGEKCGLSRAYISMLESGRNPTTNSAFSPRLETLEKIAETMGKTLDELINAINPTEKQREPTDNYGRTVTQYQSYLDARFRRIPILGALKPGPKGVTLVDYMGDMPIDAAMPGNIVALVVDDDGMEDLLTKGDLVFVSLQDHVESGRVAVVSLNNGEGVLRRVENFSDGFILLSSNPSCEPDIITSLSPRRVQILGEIIGKVHWCPGVKGAPSRR